MTATFNSDRAAWLSGPKIRCSVRPEPKKIPRRLVLLGAPGVGKGTQAQLLSEKLGACHLSTGDLFRAAKTFGDEKTTPAMKIALECMQRGELVPDETVLALVVERKSCLRCKGGFLLDGFPRTIAQAEALDRLLSEEKIPLEAVLRFELQLDIIIERLAGRRTCSRCKAVYHTEALPPKLPGICDACGGALVQRDDDRPEAIRERMGVYERSTVPLIQYYERRGLLISIPAHGSPETVAERTLKGLQDWQAWQAPRIS